MMYGMRSPTERTVHHNAYDEELYKEVSLLKYVIYTAAPHDAALELNIPLALCYI
jgi:hypothetical protein